MPNYRLGTVGLGAVLLTACYALRADPPVKQEAPAAPAPDAAQQLAAKIDHHVRARWKADGITPEPRADDAEFLRRVYLDLAGRIPAVSEVQTFLNDKAPDKRRRLVDRLLDGPAYVNHFTAVWRALLLPETNSNFELQYLSPGFEGWLQKQVADNVSYDKMVRELLTVPLQANQDPMQAVQDVYAQAGQVSPLSFYLAKEGKPENLADSTARLFLGIRLGCAQCHHHPYAKWKREQFWEYAAFFNGIQRQGPNNIYSPIREVFDRHEVNIPGTEKVVQAKFLDGAEPEWKFKTGPRVTLADWMTSPKNPYFARAAANRLWGYFLGVGLVDPVDDMGGDNPTSHPELLDELAKQFADNGFDFKFLIRAITSSEAYQLTSRGKPSASETPQHFARMAIKRMTPEQVYDSLALAIGYRDPLPPGQRGFVDFGNNNPRSEFLGKFNHSSERPTDVETSILQALTLMNGKFIADGTNASSNVEQTTTLAAIANAPFMDTKQRVETLFLATLSRKPKPAELDRFVQYVESGGPRNDSKRALADVFWVLLNSGEFILNH